MNDHSRIFATKHTVFSREFTESILLSLYNYTPSDVITIVASVENQIIESVKVRGCALLNDALSSLGFSRTVEGCIYGWTDPNNVYITCNVDIGDKTRIWVYFFTDGIVYDKVYPHEKGVEKENE